MKVLENEYNKTKESKKKQQGIKENRRNTCETSGGMVLRLQNKRPRPPKKKSNRALHAETSRNEPRLYFKG